MKWELLLRYSPLLAQNHINVDIILQGVGHEERKGISALQ